MEKVATLQGQGFKAGTGAGTAGLEAGAGGATGQPINKKGLNDNGYYSYH